MQIGVPSEVKVHEGRVAMVPAGVRALTSRGHTVRVQAGAGLGSGISDTAFAAAGAVLVSSAEEVWASSEMIVKVKEPVASEHRLIQKGQTLFTYFHLAAVPELAPVLLDKKATAVAYETIQLPSGRLPLLQPMSEVAGKMSVQIGAGLLEKERGGKGVLLGGVPGVRRGKVVVIGGGTVGTAAAKIAVGMGANVTLLDVSLQRLEYLDDIFGSTLQLLHSNADTIEHAVRQADLVVGAVLLPGARAPKLVSAAMVAQMEPGSAVVDVAIDQGGCIETIRPTSHDAPTYRVSDVIHYGVTNMPGAVAQTSTFALTNATMNYAVTLAEKGVVKAVKEDAALALGVNTYQGHITHAVVADALKLPYQTLASLI
jgi:alanine dehydrogenase